MANEVANTNENQNVEVSNAVITREDDKFIYFIDTDGKHKRKMKYKDYSSFKAESKEDKIWLMNVIDNEDEDAGSGLKDNVGKKIEVADVIFRKYDRVNEETGELEYGVLTYLITPEREAFVTSSKSVYSTANNAFEMFGYPDHEEYENVIFEVKSKKAQNGTQIYVRVVG